MLTGFLFSSSIPVGTRIFTCEKQRCADKSDIENTGVLLFGSQTGPWRVSEP